MHGASRLGTFSYTFFSSESVSRERLPEERYLSWVEDEARGASEALHCLPKTSPSRDVYGSELALRASASVFPARF